MQHIGKFYKLIFFTLCFPLVSIASTKIDSNEFKLKLNNIGISLPERSKIYNTRTAILFESELLQGELVQPIFEAEKWCYFSLKAVAVAIDKEGAIADHSETFFVGQKKIDNCKYNNAEKVQEVLGTNFMEANSFIMFNQYMRLKVSDTLLMDRIKIFTGDIPYSWCDFESAFMTIENMKNKVIKTKHVISGKGILTIFWNSIKGQYRLQSASWNESIIT